MAVSCWRCLYCHRVVISKVAKTTQASGLQTWSIEGGSYSMSRCLRPWIQLTPEHPFNSSWLVVNSLHVETPIVIVYCSYYFTGKEAIQYVCQCQSVCKLQMPLPINRTCVCKDALTLFVLPYIWICLSTAIYFNVLQLWAHPSSSSVHCNVGQYFEPKHTQKSGVLHYAHSKLFSSTLQFKLIRKTVTFCLCHRLSHTSHDKRPSQRQNHWLTQSFAPPPPPAPPTAAHLIIKIHSP